MWELDYKEKLSSEELMLLNCGFGGLLRVPWTARRSNQSILKRSVLNIHWKDWCWSCNSNTLTTQYEELTFEKTLMLGKIEGRRRGWERMRWLDGITDSMGMSLSELWELVMGQGTLCTVVHGVTKSQTWLSDWTELNWTEMLKWYVNGESQ